MVTILVIEDQHILRENIVEMLQYAHYDVYGAQDGLEGIRLIDQHHPDLIICDIMMNNMDGYGVLEHVRSQPLTAATPFIFLSAKEDRASVRQGMGLGAYDYITKPFQTDELLNAVQARLARRQEITREAERSLEDAKRQLMHMVTHELRTPLTSINMVVDILSRQSGMLTPQQLDELLETMASGSKRLSRLVEQIVLATQLRTGSIQPETIQQNGVPMPLWETMVAAIGLARRHAYRNPNVTVNLDERDKQALVLCNVAALKHALSELITNAINFSPEGGSIAISQWKSKGVVWISITDNGPGLSEAQLQRALEHFQQIDRASKEQQGMGLGLGLAHHLINAHGGKLEVRSVPGKGTQVIVGLPLYMETRE